MKKNPTKWVDVDLFLILPLTPNRSPNWWIQKGIHTYTQADIYLLEVINIQNKTV